jgi:DnaK suppressor protein
MAANDRRTDGPAWSTEELLHFEQRLVEERKRALVQMGQFGEELGTSLEAATGELTSWRFHMADIGTETFEREQNFLLASREGQLLWHIDEALRRLYGAPETFGVCEQCGTRIAFERLDAIPYVVRCVDCKQGWESGRGEGDS